MNDKEKEAFEELEWLERMKQSGNIGQYKPLSSRNYELRKLYAIDDLAESTGNKSVENVAYFKRLELHKKGLI